jgi:hypothetical protein
MRPTNSPASSSSISSSTFTDEETLPSLDAALLDDIAGGCAACGTPGQPCQQPTAGQGGQQSSPFAQLAPLLASFAQRQ